MAETPERSNIVRLSPAAAGAGGTGGPYNPDMEARVAKLESDVDHIRSDISEIKTLLGRLAPRIDEMYGRQASLATREDIATLRLELERRPTRRQAVFDIFALVALIGALLAIGSRLTN